MAARDSEENKGVLIFKRQDFVYVKSRYASINQDFNDNTYAKQKLPQRSSSRKVNEHSKPSRLYP